MSEDFSTATSGAKGPVLDGTWLRRERERIAIGRRQVADRLGLPESRVIRVEMNKLPVPAEWFTALSALGFPVLADVPPTNTSGATTEPPHRPTLVDVPRSVEPAPVAAAPAGPVPASPAVTAFGLGVTTDASPTLSRPEAAPESAVAQRATALESAARPSATGSDPAPAPSILPMPAESPAVAEPPAESHAEPTASPIPATRDEIGIYTGHWLRRERKKRGMMPVAIAPALHITAAELAIAEAQDLTLPLHWLPSLRQLGLPVSEEAAALAPQSTPSPQAAAPSAPKPTAKAQRTSKAQRTTSTETRADSKPLTGSWLRQVRVERSITQSWLSQQLHVNQTRVWRCESENQTLPPGWLPILRELGFPVPAALNDKSPPRVPAPVAAPAKPLGKSATREAQRTAIDGRWLKSERDRLGLSISAVRLRLHVAAKTYDKFESSRSLVPRFWWPGLRQLGMNLPATPPVPPTSSTPARGPLDGAWLASQRKRLRLTEYEVCRVVQANARMLRRIEREADVLPTTWLAKLPLLGIAVDVAAAQRRRASKTSRLTNAVPNTPPTSGQKPAIPTSPPARETVQPAPVVTSASQSADTMALIVNFRLALGQHTKQPPFEILSRILSDLREAGADQALTHEDVERAARALIRKR